jgi:hypothetical protein
MAALALYGPLSGVMWGAGPLPPSPLAVIASAGGTTIFMFGVLCRLVAGSFRRYELCIHGDVLEVRDRHLIGESRPQWRRGDIERIFVRSIMLYGTTLCIQSRRKPGLRLPGRTGLGIRHATRQEWEWVAAVLQNALDRAADPAELPTEPPEGVARASTEIRPA